VALKVAKTSIFSSYNYSCDLALKSMHFTLDNYNYNC